MDDSDPGPRLLERLEPMLRAAHAPGWSMAFFAQGKLLAELSWGARRAGAARPIDAKTRFQAASLSKPVACVTALALADLSVLDLDSDVGAILPLAGGEAAGLAGSFSGVTLRSLFSHTAGLTVDGFAGYQRGARLPSLWQSIRGVPPANNAPVTREAEPGEAWAYSGGGYLLAQAVMEVRAGRPFAELARGLVLEPAGMATARFEPLRRGTPRASGHDTSGQPLPGGWQVYPELAAAGLWCAPADLARLALAVQASMLGGPSALLRPATACLLVEPGLGGFSLGFHADGEARDRRLRHSGSNAGYRCELRFRVGPRGEGAVLMSNGDAAGALIQPLFEAIDAELGWRLGGP